MPKLKITAAVFLLLLPFFCKADCGYGGLSVLPNDSVLPANGVLIIQEYDRSANVIAELNKKYPVYLHCGTDTVKLSVIETCNGQMYFSQAIVKPVSPLTPGKTYTLIIQGVAPEMLYRYNSSIRKSEAVTFRISESHDTVAPSPLAKAPVEIRKKYSLYGCGPSTHVIFQCAVKDSSVVFARTTVTNETTGVKSTGYIPIVNSEISVGHGMCTGLFVFPDEGKYTLTVSYMDASGNTTAQQQEVVFTRPTIENSVDE